MLQQASSTAWVANTEHTVLQILSFVCPVEYWLKKQKLDICWLLNCEYNLETDIDVKTVN